MSIEIIGMVGTKEVSESRGSFDGPPIDAGYLTRFAQAHEAAGFDRVLIGYGATGPDGFAVAAHVLYATSALKVLIAHRPGFVAPTLVARKLATLDQLTGGGRVAVHHITGGDELDQKRDGDFEDHDRRYARTAEFMSLLRRELTAAEPFDHDGEFYRVRGAYSSVRPAADAPIPLYFGGASPAAVQVGAQHADVYMLWGEPVAQIGQRIAQIRSAAARHGRTVRFSLSVRPIVARTEEAAWRRAEEIRSATARRVADATTAQVQGVQVPARGARLFGFRESSSVGSERLQRQAADRDVHDERLWYGVTKLTGPGGNSTALVRTEEPVPRVGTFLVRSDAPGITIEPTWDHLGLRASRSDDVIFADTPVPAGAVTGLTEPAAAAGPDALLMAWNGLGLTALYLGVASAARDWLIGFLTERTPTALGRPLATLPRFQSAVGEIEASLTAASDLVNGLATRADAGDPVAASHAGMAKLIGTRAAIGAVEQAVALVGNNGLTRKYPLERHYRDVLCARVHTPQDDSVVAAAGQSALAVAGLAETKST